MWILAALVWADPGVTCADARAPVVLEIASPAWSEADQACRALDALLAVRAPVTSTSAREAERALLETTWFSAATCTVSAARVACRAVPGTLVADGRVEGSLPFNLLKSDVDRRLSLRSGVPLTEPMAAAGARQADRIAAYLEREGYFGTTATAAWAPADGAEPMRAAELTVTVDTGDSTTLRRVAVRGDTGVLSAVAVRERLQHYWLINRFIARRFRPLDFEDDLDAITEELRRSGYPEALVRGRYVVDRADDAVDVIIDVSAGARLELSFTGNTALDDEDLAELSTFDEARSLDAEEIEHTAAAIRAAYQRRGYFEVQVESRLVDRPRPTLGVAYDVTEGRRAFLASVTLTGTTALDPEVLLERAALKTRTRAWPVRSGAWVDEWVEHDQRAFAEVLAAAGYGRATVEATLEVRGEGELAATFTLDAGPLHRVGALKLVGLPAEIDRAALEGALALRPGQPYAKAAQTPDRRAILDALAAAGYPRAEVSRKLKLPATDEPGEVSLTYTIAPGRRATYGGLLVRGNLETARAVLEDNVALEIGQPLSAKAISDVRRRLAAIGVFGVVEVVPLGLWRDDAPTWLLVTVEERVRRSLFAVLSFSTDDYFAVGADYTDRNLFGRALSLDLELRFANASQLGTDLAIGQRDRALLRLGAPRPFGAPFDVEARAYYDLVTRPETYDERRVGGSLAVSRALVERGDCAACPSLVATVGYELSATEVTVRAEDVVLEEPPATIGRVFARLVADRRDNALDPRSGYLGELRVELANRALAGPFVDYGHDFWRLLPSAKGYLELGAPLEARLDEGQIIGGPFVLAGAATYGVAHPYGSEDRGEFAVPRSETFAYGGDQSVRGLADGASRVGAPSPPYLAFLSAELRYYVLQNFGFGTVQLAGFVDVGAVSAHLGELFDDPTLSAGPALRYVTPVGPLSVAYGWPLVRARAIEAASPDVIPASGRLHISFGTAF